MNDIEYELVTIEGSIQVAVPPSLNLITTYVLKEQRDWFEDEMQFVRKLVKPGMNVVDVGANYGAYALTMGKSVLPNGNVWAFEPAMRTACFLRKSVEVNDLRTIHIVEAGLSNRDGTAILHTDENAELNTLNPTANTSGGTETINLRTLDSCQKEFGWSSISFLKLDAEGEETRILEGGTAFFSNHDPLCMFELKHGTATNTALVQTFHQMGYSTYRLIPGLGILVPFDGQDPDPFQLNLFACSATRAASCAADRILVFARSSEESSAADSHRWTSLAQGMPYARSLAEQWALSSAASTAGRHHVEEALACYAEAHDETLGANARVAALEASFKRMATACECATRPSRLLTVARVAADLGQRMIAVQALDAVLRALEDGTPFAFDEPFLSPNPRFDFVDPQDKLESWGLASLVEQLELLSHYSSFYTGEASLPRLTYFRDLGFAGPQMERRLALVQARLGNPTPSPK